jgi:carotenoid cleavage dioxygenase-like enzyme
MEGETISRRKRQRERCPRADRFGQPSNGPNPKFPPLGSYTYPLDGDGMIHGVWLADGKARYRNRYVLTEGLAAEMKAGSALWGGVMTPAAPPAALAI